MPFAIQTHELTHHFGDRCAVEQLALEVPLGAVYGFLGPNGSGKTTTIRLLLGLLRPQSGEVMVLGRPMPRDRLRIAREIGSLVETPCLYAHLTGFENVDLTRRALGLARTESRRVLELVGLGADADRRVGGYSLGMRQRLGVARALLGRPRLLILDEPTNGLDPQGVLEIRDLIRDLPRQHEVTVFVSSHLLAEVGQIATHVGLMRQGRLIAQSTLAELLGSAGRRIELRAAPLDAALRRLDAEGLAPAVDAAGVIHLPASGRDTITAAAINTLLVGDGVAVSHLSERTPGLEEVFLQRTAAGPSGS